MESTVTRAYEAFRVLNVADSAPGQQRVESLCCWNGYLLVGVQDGTIVQYAPPPNGGPWQVVKKHRSLARKAVTQMAAVRLAARPLLLTLTEEGVNLLTLPDLQLKFQPMGLRGASMFAWNEEAQLLAVAVRRRVILYNLHGSELLDAGERTAPDVVAVMLWAQAKSLLLGMRRQYVLLNAATGVVTDVAPTGTAPHPVAQLCGGGQEMLLARDNCTYYHSTADGRHSRRRHLAWSEPLLALAAVGQHAVAVTASGLEVRSLRRVAEGHVVQRVRLSEPQRPVTPAVSEDGSVFAAAVAPAGSTCTAGSVPAAAAAATATASNVIYQLVPVPLEEQARTLAELGEYGEALALAALVDDEEGEGAGEAMVAETKLAEPGEQQQPPEAVLAAASAAGATLEAQAEGRGEAAAKPIGVAVSIRGRSSRRALLEERLRIAYGHYLFQSGEYDVGMAQLFLRDESHRSTTALVLLRLFPSLVPAKFKHFLPALAAGQPLPDVPEPTGEAYVTAVSQLLPYIISSRTRALTEAKAAAAGDNADQGTESASSAGSTVHHDGRGASEPNCVSGSGHLEAPQAPGRQGPGSKVGGSGGSSGAGAGASPDGCGAGHEGTGGESPEPSPQELLVVLDTAIVRIMAVMPDTGELLRFVQKPNYVDLREGEVALSEVAMYAELAALYRYNGCHEEGLELLRKLSQEPGALPRPPRGAAADLPGLPGVWAAVRYIVSLSEEDAPVIQQHAGWILAADASAGLSALLYMRPPLHPSLALSILNQHSKHYCGLYLETALKEGVALPQDYHNELLLIYLRDILAKEPPSPSRTSAHSGAELRELLLAHRPDPDQPPLLFPDDLAHALLNNPPQHGPAGHHGAAVTTDGAASHRRFASAPGSSVGTPGTLSRVPSQTSIHSGVGGGAGGRAAANGARQGVRTSSGPGGAAGAASAVQSGRASPPGSASSGEESSSEDKEEEEDAHAEESSTLPSRSVTTSKGKPAPAAASPPTRHGIWSTLAKGAGIPERHASSSSAATPPPVRRPRRPRRSSTGAVGPSGGKPPLPPTAPTAAGPADAEAAASAAAAAAAGPSLYQRLRDLVYTSPYIDPGYVLDKLPTGELLEIRALMLERLGNHRDALRLYVHALRDLNAAEEYCDRVHAAAVAAAGGSGGAAARVPPAAGAAGAGGGRLPAAPPPYGPGALAAGLLGYPGSPGGIYLELVQALFDGPESCPSAAVVAAAAAGGHAPVAQGLGWSAAQEAAGSGGGSGDAKLDPATWQALSKLLSRKRGRVDPMKVLSLLPDGVAVADVLPWLESALRFTMEARRNLAVLRQLRRIENLSAQEDAARMRQHQVVVTYERACSLCHKRIGNVVAVSYPKGGQLAHYNCHKRHTGDEGAGAMAEMGHGAGMRGGGGAVHQVVELQHGSARGMRGGSAGGAGGAELAAVWA